MPRSILVVAGVANSGKSRTLHKIADGHEVVDERVYSIRGRRTCIYFSSPQERTRKACKRKSDVECARLVAELVKDMIEKCDSQHCDLLVITFTICVMRGELNKACIMRPWRYLKKKAKKACMIYLRKDTARKIDLINRLMSRLKAEPIPSRKDEYERQAREVLRVINSLP